MSVPSQQVPVRLAQMIDNDVDDDEPVTQEYLNDLLNKAKANLRAKMTSSAPNVTPVEEDIMMLDTGRTTGPLPPLDPGPIADRPCFDASVPSHFDTQTFTGDLKAQIVGPSLQKTPQVSVPGKIITKKQRKEAKNATAGPSWFDLPAPTAADIPKLYREVEALRMRNSMDPKRFYRRDTGEGKGTKSLPKYFAIGKVVDTPTPFNATSEDNLTKAERKRSLVDELVADSEARSYAKRKFEELQGVRGARGRGTLHRKQRQRKW